MKTVTALSLLAAPMAALAATLPPNEPDGFKFSVLGSSTCPTGSSHVTTFAECQVFTAAMSGLTGSSWGSSDDGGDPTTPPGCYCYLNWPGCYFNANFDSGMSLTFSGAFTACKDTPWDLEQKQVSTDFSTPGTGQVDIAYLGGKDRAFDHRITASVCGDAAGSPVTSGVVVSSVDAIGPEANTDPFMEWHVVRHEINISALVGSNIFTAADNSLAFCQEAELYQPVSDGQYVITQLRTDVTVALNMTATFEADVTLAEGTVSQENQTVDLDDQVDAYPCTDLEDPTPKGGDVAPNQVVHICVRTNTEDIEIESLDTMTAKGRANGDDEFKIVDGSAAVVAAITKINPYNATLQVVQTRLPINKVTYASDNSVDIFGTLTLKLGGRRLAVAAATPGRRLQVQDAADEGAAGFALELALAPADEDERAPVAVASAAAAGAVRAGVLVAVAAVALLG